MIGTGMRICILDTQLMLGEHLSNFDDSIINMPISGDNTYSGFDLDEWRQNYIPIHERVLLSIYLLDARVLYS